MRFFPSRVVVSGGTILVVMLAVHGALAADAQPRSTDKEISIPTFIDPDRRIDRREALRLGAIRFITEEEYPPFNYVGKDGLLVGFNIDLARVICAELSVSCTIQSRRWDLLLPTLDRREAEAVIAGHRITSDLRREYEVSMPVFRSPARFVGRIDRWRPPLESHDFSGRNVGVVGGSAHEAFLNAMFPAIRLVRFERPIEALEAMRRGDTDLAFVDGVTGGFWMNGSDSLDCCSFVDGPYTETRFFGEGAGIVLRKENVDLRNAIDQALWRISRDGRYAKLYLKHFPMPLY